MTLSSLGRRRVTSVYKLYFSAANDAPTLASETKVPLTLYPRFTRRPSTVFVL